MTLNELIEKARELGVDFDKLITLSNSAHEVDVYKIEVNSGNGGLTIVAF